jgi:hypothetical protein
MAAEASAVSYAAAAVHPSSERFTTDYCAVQRSTLLQLICGGLQRSPVSVRLRVL